MMFEIQPQELGFTDTVNKSTGEVQSDIGNKTGLTPLAEFIAEILTDIVQIDMGYDYLKFDWTDLENTDEKAKAELNKTYIESGQRTIDEVRSDDNMEPLGGGAAKPFVIGTPTFLDQDSLDQKAAATEALTAIASQSKDAEEPVDKSPDNEEDGGKPVDNTEKAMVMLHEFRTFRKYAITRAKNGKPIRVFKSDIIPEVVLGEINKRLSKAASPAIVRGIFNEFMKDYQLSFIADLASIKKEIDSVI